MTIRQDMDDKITKVGNNAQPPLGAPGGIQGLGCVDQDSPHSTVGIGASAGGLESLERVFSNMPCDTGMAFVVIQHLSPDFKSLMHELLARHTELPIRRAEEGMRVESNSVYLIPPKKEMIISGGRLLLTDKDPKQALTMPIDRFFRSLAQDAGERAVGVILSGTGSDGSRGIRDIHAAGGLVICESKESAKFDGMPQAAIETGVVDQLMPADSISAALTDRKLRTIFTNTDAADEPPSDGTDIVFALLNDAYGINFSCYKPNTVRRRIQRRLSLVGARDLDDYATRLRSDPNELNSLYKDLLIGVTRFFRDRDAYEKIQSEVVPELLRKVDDGEEIRIWVAGCATGEEAYSMAIILHEQLEAVGQPINVKIFATDVHRASLEIAGAGVYGEDALADVTPQRLDRYFEREGDGYRVTPDLRQMVVFATHNVTEDAPFTKLDLITCRNLLIYFQPAAQRKVLSLFHFGLKTGGCLFLGPSESPGELLDEFEAIDVHWKLYRKCRDVRLPADLDLPPGKSLHLQPPVSIRSTSQPRSLPDASLIAAYDAMLDKFMPAGLLITENRELLHTFGGAERYLQARGGRPTDDVLDMLDRELRTAVTGAVQRVLRDRTAVSYSGVRVNLGGTEQRLRVAVEPIDNPQSQRAQLMILMEPIQDPASGSADGPVPLVVDDDVQQIAVERIDSLEGELRYTKENLQATIEELEASNEEMHATNEELVASNEELQSTNEELQSVNEELYTVNAEYQNKIAELSELTSDMDNLLVSTEVGTIFLDRELNIRKFTPQIGQEFHLLPQDIGRPINSFAHNITYPELIDDLRRVVGSETPCENEVQDRQGKWLYLRILPYRTKAKRVDGVVLTLIDITPLKQAQQQLTEAVRRRDEFLAMLSHELRNPLGAILSSTQVMERIDVQNPMLRDTCEVVRRQGRQMSRLLDDLLDVSRVTQNKIELHIQPTDVHTIIKNAVESAQPLIEAAELKFSEETSGEPMFVHGDAARLQQALSNLLGNAAKYTPKGGKVSLHARPDNGEVLFTVRDTGVGLPPDKLESIFDLFVQSDHTLHRSDGGMGIGLTLVRSIVEMHSGRVTAHSKGPGQGSTFEIRLPRLESPLGESRVDPQDDSFTSNAAGDGRVVIVEDQDDARRMLRSLLELDGYDVHEAENGTRGLALIERVHPDIALIDIGLPGIDGYELARQLRRSLGNKRTYLVALTGYGQPGDVDAAFDAGFDEHIVKPLDPQKLSRILRLHCHKGEKAPADATQASKTGRYQRPHKPSGTLNCEGK